MESGVEHDRLARPAPDRASHARITPITVPFADRPLTKKRLESGKVDGGDPGNKHPVSGCSPEQTSARVRACP